MLMSVIEGARSALAYPELAGKRVLITGVTGACGVDIARAFAEHRTRLVLQFAEASTEMEAVAEIVAPYALETQVFGPVGEIQDDVVGFARKAVQAFGGLDAVINVVRLSCREVDRLASVEDIERRIAGRLALPFLTSKIAANRMSLALTEGMILNVATIEPGTRAAGAFAAVAKSALAGMTRAQADEWARRGIRFNAVAPASALSSPDGLCGEPDVAGLALYLASGRGTTLSGHVFEAEHAA